MHVADIRIDLANRLYLNQFVTDKSGARTIEIPGVSFIADEPSIFGIVNEDYVKRELVWYKSMSLNVRDIPGKVPEIWKQVANKDGLINSNYGWCIWASENFNQYESCLAELITNTHSRRAVMIYTRPTMHTDAFYNGCSDFMCTNTVQYMIRDNKMHCVVMMRSNDVVFGYRNDRAWQLHVLNLLVDDYNRLSKGNVQVGDIHWLVGSLHVYERHFELVAAFQNRNCPTA